MKETPETARVGIRGADTKAIKVFIRQKSTHELNRLERVLLIVGGNNLGKKEGGKQVPNQSAIAVREALEELARFMRTWAPNAEVVTTDIIPRDSEFGFFNARARLIAQYISPQDPKHHHASILRPFLIISRVKASEKYRSKDFFYEGGDRVHMNPAGYAALDSIADWLLADSRGAGDRFDASVHGHVVSFTMKF